jgi:probable phosphoglycerate mutase
MKNTARAKTIIIARHGESRANATEVREGSESPLTKRGVLQAELLGKRLKGEPITRIVASDYVRAHETAKIVGAAIGMCDITLSPHFRERRNPSLMYGKSHNDPQVEKMWNEIGWRYGEIGWRYSDEENFEDVINRATWGLDQLAQMPDDLIFVASHGLFMKVLFAHIVLGDLLNGRIFWDKFVPMAPVANTGVMEIAYTKTYDGSGMYWKLLRWNDSAHLGGVAR